MADTGRARKVAERIKDVIAENLQSVIKDPDLGFLTITDVRVTGDLQHASVFYTVFGDDDQAARTARLLTANTGRLRSLVGKHLGIRLTPQHPAGLAERGGQCGRRRLCRRRRPLQARRRRRRRGRRRKRAFVSGQ